VKRPTDRQLQVLATYARCGTQAETARQLGIHVQTVKNHLLAASQRLGTKSAIGSYMALGWLRIP
jgi:DNA-binding CsgD family transcriptional regulator